MKDGKKLFVVLFFVYIALVLYITLFAWNYGASLGPAGPGGRNYNLIPFRSIYRISVFSQNWLDPVKILIGNILLFFPLGFFLPVVCKKMTSFRPIVMCGFFFSLVIEVTQFSFTYRVADIDDLLLNTFGAFCGAAVYFFIVKVKRRIVIW